MSNKSDRPLDINQLAKLIADIVTGETSKENLGESIPQGRAGGLKGGKARAEKLNPVQRIEIAKKAVAEEPSVIENVHLIRFAKLFRH